MKADVVRVVLLAASVTLLLFCTSPSVNEAPTGPAVGMVDSAYTFSATAPTSGSGLLGRFDWGDGVMSDWIEWPAGGACRGTHAWTAAGDFEVRVQAKDGWGGEGEWSPALPFHVAPQYPNRAVLEWFRDEESYQGCVVSANGELVYVGSGMAGTVMLFRTSDLTPVGGIEVNEPDEDVQTMLAMTPDRSRMYAACDEAGKVVVIRMSDLTVVDSILTDEDPLGVAVHPSGEFAYVTRRRVNGSVVVVRTSDNTIIRQIGTGDSPTKVAFTPDGGLAYIAGGKEPWVWVVRTSDHALIDSIPTDDEPLAVAVTPDGNKLYVVNRWGGLVTCYSTATFAVLSRLTLGTTETRAIAVLPNGEYAYVPGLDEDEWAIRVHVIRTADNAVVASFIVAALADVAALDAAPSPAGDRVYVTTRDGSVAAIGF